MSTTAATPAKAPWENWWYRKYEEYLHYECNGGYVNYTNEYTKLPEGALGSWRWKQNPSGQASLVITINWNSPSPKHHGDWSKEAALAHMVVHAEEGTHCTGADPQEWGAYERELDTRAMARMGWESWRSQTIWDEESRRMVPCELEAHRATSHVAKSELRRRSTTPARVSASKGRR